MITIYSKKKETIEFLREKIEFSEYKIILNENLNFPLVFTLDLNKDVKFTLIIFSSSKAFTFTFIIDLMISLINIERKRIKQIVKQKKTLKENSLLRKTLTSKFNKAKRERESHVIDFDKVIVNIVKSFNKMIDAQTVSIHELIIRVEKLKTMMKGI